MLHIKIDPKVTYFHLLSRYPINSLIVKIICNTLLGANPNFKIE